MGRGAQGGRRRCEVAQGAPDSQLPCALHKEGDKWRDGRGHGGGTRVVSRQLRPRRVVLVVAAQPDRGQHKLVRGGCACGCDGCMWADAQCVCGVAVPYAYYGTAGVGSTAVQD